MDLSLSGENEKFLRSQITAGLYKTLNEALNATLSIAISKISIPQERLDELNAEIQKGIDDYEAGRVIDGETAFKELLAKYE